MKVPEQHRLKNHPLLSSNSSYGNNGFFLIPHYRINNYEIRCQVSDGEGWEHVSVTIAPVNKHATRCPTWEEMCWVKDQFWDDGDVVVQFHPAKKDHVSMHHFCLHLWRPTNKAVPVPDPLMVGVNVADGENMAEKIQQALHDAEERTLGSMTLPDYKQLI